MKKTLYFFTNSSDLIKSRLNNFENTYELFNDNDYS